ncbi:RTX toxins and related Ca2+-binding protein [Microscilla marina]|uniref:RTX toxins and related Ca2+-binding protein n=1 Tax=Microscilla marina ATCC 23134 TaxID=313606 RepID=A1ZSF2_MICM2|nr:RTX toxins and related Ca2+-binding protein [Microscilla marina]EAY26700.1 RTX toxins and related Ca2+-binding protein [Microscilla marina ATCC 23134]
MKLFQRFILWQVCSLLLFILGISSVSVAQNTPQVIDIYTGFNNSSNPSELTAIGDKLIFNATTSGAGKEPHLSDGTVTGTSLVQDVFPGTNSSDSRDFTEFKIGGTTYVYYFANDGTQSGALYRTNMATGTTELVVNVNPPGSISSSPGAGSGKFLVNVNGTLFFAGQDPKGRQECLKVMVLPQEPYWLKTSTLLLWVFSPCLQTPKT